LVRGLHDAVAQSSNLAAASTRPARTTAKDMSRMVSDVLFKLDVSDSVSVVEIGCGVGVLALPIAGRARRYLGLDFASVAVERLRDELATAGLSDRATAESIDFVSAAPDEISRLGQFDRVLMYAVLHYARTEQEGAIFVRRAAELLAPGGIGLFGNLPLEDLAALPNDGTSFGRLTAKVRWVLQPAEGLPHGRVWRLKLFAFELGRRLRSSSSAKDAEEGYALPAGYVLPLTKARVENWLRSAGPGITWQWLTPRIGVPLHRRADLVLYRAAL
jgi:SAM-dependent methyltransferase